MLLGRLRASAVQQARALTVLHRVKLLPVLLHTLLWVLNASLPVERIPWVLYACNSSVSQKPVCKARLV